MHYQKHFYYSSSKWAERQIMPHLLNKRFLAKLRVNNQENIVYNYSIGYVAQNGIARSLVAHKQSTVTLAHVQRINNYSYALQV